MGQRRKQERSRKRLQSVSSKDATPRSSAAAYTCQGRAEGVAAGMALASQRLRESERIYSERAWAHAKGLPYEQIWTYGCVIRPLLDCFLELAKQFDNLSESSRTEAAAYESVSATLVAALDARMPGARGRAFGRRAVQAARALAGNPPDGL